MTKKEMKNDFEAYFRDLKAEAKAAGYSVNKADEWELFKNHMTELNEREVSK